MWVAPLPGAKSHLPDWEHISRGHSDEAVNVYTRNGVLNRHVGSFDLTPDPAVHDVGEVWLVAGETLVPDASRLFRSRPNNFRNPLMTPDGAPAVAFQWMEVEGPLYDASPPRATGCSSAICRSKPNLEVVSTNPARMRIA